MDKVQERQQKNIKSGRDAAVYGLMHVLYLLCGSCFVHTECIIFFLEVNYFDIILYTHMYDILMILLRLVYLTPIHNRARRHNFLLYRRLFNLD